MKKLEEREIKFRCLCETDNGIEMIYFEPTDYDNGLWFNSEEHITTYLSPKSQYTGLKDKNGLEIWEGDIVKSYSIDEGYLQDTVSYEISSFVLCNPNKLTWALSDYKSENIEVIGNIYEHPELLTPKQS